MNTYTLDISGEHCPMTFVKTRLKLEELKPGDQLEVLVKKGEPLDNLPKTVTEYGFQVVKISQLSTELFQILIAKGL